LLPIAAALVLPVSAWAQDSESSTAQSALAQAALPGVEVTGQKPRPPELGYRPGRSAASGFRDTPVLETPFSVSVFSAELIEDQQARSVAEVLKNDPAVTLASDPLWYDRVNVRGFYLSTDAVQRDGLSINDQGSIALENKAAVELTKGPASMRYGFTSPGGVLNYVVKRPTDNPLARASLQANGFGGYGANADFGGRFGAGNAFGVRVNAAVEELASYVDEFNGDRKFFSTFFDWRWSDQLLIELDFEHQQGEKTAPGSPSLWWWDSVAEARAAFPRLDAKTYVAQPWNVEPNEQTYFAGRASYRFNAQWRMRLAGQSAYLSRDQLSLGPVSVQPDGTFDAFLYAAPDQERNNHALQWVVEGDVITGTLKHELAFGIDDLRRDMTAPDGFYDSIGTGNLFTPRAIANPNVASTPSYLFNRTEQRSYFLSDTIRIGERWQVLGGLRRTEIEISGQAAAGAPRMTSYDKSVVNPTAAVLFKPAAAWTVYGSYAEGIEQGGTAPLGTANQNEVLDPLQSKQVELGSKLQLPGGALLTAALFEIDRGLEYVNSANVYVQDGRQVHRGVELAVQGQVLPMLRVVAGTAWLQAKVEDSGDPTLDGKRPQGVPQWQANVFADLDLGTWQPGLSVNGGVYYGGKKAIDIENTWFADAFVRLDLGARYMQRLAAGRSATYRLVIENVADKRYLANTTWGALTFGAPRTVKAAATVDF
jgi:iron complex outermembrane receptor protein